MHDADRHADRRPGRADALAMFGLTGDLGEKKLFGALVELERAGRLGIPVVAVGRSELSDDELRRRFVDAVDDADAVDRIPLTYLRGDVADAATFDRLDERLGRPSTPVVYAALPPSTFPDLARSIADSPMSDDTRLVIEKPFGHDVASACALRTDLIEALDEHRLYLVDHFLAKTAVENLGTVRHANPLIDSAMCAALVESIHVVMSETGSVAGRGSFYDGVGAIDDVVQNHILQTLALALMDAPADETDAAFHRARADLLASIEPIDWEDAVLAQYVGYRDHDGVADDSDVETFVDLRLAVDTDRWRGVPVRITTGKQLAEDETSITFTLRRAGPDVPPNRLRFGIKPSASIEIELGVLDPGPGDDHRLRTTTVRADVPGDHASLGDYATLLDQAMSGSQRHFAQLADVVEGWRIVGGARPDRRPEPYDPGTDVHAVPGTG